MIKIFFDSLELIGVKKDSIKIGIRLFDDIDKNEAIIFWAEVLGVSVRQISSIDVLHGKKKGKLLYGMCRIRVAKGGESFKLIMSIIERIKKEMISAAVVQRIERGTPKP